MPLLIVSEKLSVIEPKGKVLVSDLSLRLLLDFTKLLLAAELTPGPPGKAYIGPQIKVVKLSISWY